MKGNHISESRVTYNLVAWLKFTLLLVLASTFVSMACEPKMVASYEQPNRTYHVRPEALQVILKTVLEEPPINVHVESAHEGRIVTVAETCEGDYHGFLLWRKRWLQRRQYSFFIQYSWGSLERSDLYVKIRIEETPNEHCPWEPGKQVDMDNRVLQILSILDNKLGR